MYTKIKECEKTIERVVPTQLDDVEIGALREHIARYNFILKYVKDKNVLDAACGTGYGSSLMSYVAKSITGYDLSSEALDYAKQLTYYCPTRFAKKKLGTKIPDKKFDVIVSFETIEHIKEIEKFIEWVARNSKMFIFSIPNELYDRKDNNFHLHRFTLEKIKNIVGKYFNNVSWAGQSLNGLDFKSLTDIAEAKFFIGIAQNI